PAAAPGKLGTRFCRGRLRRVLSPNCAGTPSPGSAGYSPDCAGERPSEGGAWGRRDAGALQVARSPASLQLQLEALLAAVHGPVVVGGEDRLDDRGEVLQERLLGVDAPLVEDVEPLAVLEQVPLAVACEVAARQQAEPVGWI